MPRDNRCVYMGHFCINVCCSDCVRVCVNVCCVSDVYGDNVISPGVLNYVVYLCMGM